jgi:hypothetical protein
MGYAFSTSEPVLDMVSTWGPWGRVIGSLVGAAPGSGTFEAANRTIYHPIYIPTTLRVRRFWWINGTTVSASVHYIAAIYADNAYKPGRRIDTTASTAQGTATQVQFADATVTAVCQPGLYWVALGADSNTSTNIFLTGVSLATLGALKYQEATATPPAVATPVAAGSTNYYHFGFSTVTSP